MFVGIEPTSVVAGVEEEPEIRENGVVAFSCNSQKANFDVRPMAKEVEQQVIINQLLRATLV